MRAAGAFHIAAAGGLTGLAGACGASDVDAVRCPPACQHAVARSPCGLTLLCLQVCDDRPERGGAELAALLPSIPTSRLMIETDAPYLVSAPERCVVCGHSVCCALLSSAATPVHESCPPAWHRSLAPSSPARPAPTGTSQRCCRTCSRRWLLRAGRVKQRWHSRRREWQLSFSACRLGSCRRQRPPADAASLAVASWQRHRAV